MRSLIAICVLVILAINPALAQDDGFCDSYPDVPINITPIFDEPLFNTSHSLEAIHQLAGDPSHVIPTYDKTILGLTHYSPVMEFNSPMEIRKLSDGTVCVRVQEINANIGYKNVTVYIAHELTDSACAVQHVLDHEKKHVAVNAHILEEYVPAIQDKLKEYLKLYGVYRGTNLEYAQGLMQEKINFVLTETAKQIMQENMERQKLIDTPEEYARNNTACNGYINALLHRLLAEQNRR